MIQTKTFIKFSTLIESKLKCQLVPKCERRWCELIKILWCKDRWELWWPLWQN